MAIFYSILLYLAALLAGDAQVCGMAHTTAWPTGGRLKSITLPSGKTTAYIYWSVTGDLTTVTDDAGATP